MDINPIKNHADYQVALQTVESLMMATADTPEGDKLDVMVKLIEDYETKHFPMDITEPCYSHSLRHGTKKSPRSHARA